MIKKGYIRTEINKYLDKLGETQEVTPQLVFDKLPEIYMMIKDDKEINLPKNVTYSVFFHEAVKGFELAKIMRFTNGGQY